MVKSFRNEQKEVSNKKIMRQSNLPLFYLEVREVSISQGYFRAILAYSKKSQWWHGYKNPKPLGITAATFLPENENENFKIMISYLNNYIKTQEGYYNQLVEFFGSETALQEKLKQSRGIMENPYKDMMQIIRTKKEADTQINETIGSLKEWQSNYTTYYRQVKNVLDDLRRIAGKKILTEGDISNLINKISKSKNSKDNQLKMQLLNKCKDNLDELKKLLYTQQKIIYDKMSIIKNKKNSYLLLGIETEGKKIQQKISITNAELEQIKNSLNNEVSTLDSISSSDFSKVLSIITEQEQSKTINELAKENKLYDIVDGKIVCKQNVSRARTLHGNFFEFLVSTDYKSSVIEGQENIADSGTILNVIQKGSTGAKVTRKILVKTETKIQNNSKALMPDLPDLKNFESNISQLKGTYDKVDDYMTIMTNTVKDGEQQQITIAFSDKLYHPYGLEDVHLVSKESNLLNNLDIFETIGANKVDTSTLVGQLIYFAINLSSASVLRHELANNFDSIINSIQIFLKGFIIDLAFNPANFSQQILENKGSVLYILHVGTLMIPSFELLKPLVAQLENMQMENILNSYINTTFSPASISAETLLEDSYKRYGYEPSTFNSMAEDVYQDIATTIASQTQFSLSVNIQAFMSIIESLMALR